MGVAKPEELVDACHWRSLPNPYRPGTFRKTKTHDCQGVQCKWSLCYSPPEFGSTTTANTTTVKTTIVKRK